MTVTDQADAVMSSTPTPTDLPTPNEAKEYLWEHFKFNADQRLKAFNFYVVLSVFADGAVYAVFQKADASGWVMPLGLFLILLAGAFWIIDARSRELMRLSEPGLRAYEALLPSHSRLFEIESGTRGRKLVRYTTAFSLLYLAQLCLGAFAVFKGFIAICQ